MESIVKDFISDIEKNIRKTNKYYHRVVETPIFHDKWQVFIFCYDMKRRDGYQIAFQLHYEGDFHTQHHFDVTFYTTALPPDAEHEHDELQQYMTEHKKEIKKHYVHFLHCLQDTIEQHKTFRLYQLMHTDFLCNKIKEDGLEKLMKIDKERKTSTVDRFKIWLHKFVINKRRNV